MNLETNVSDYSFMFADEPARLLWEPVLPRLLTEPSTLEGFQPIRARPGRPIRVFRAAVGGNRFVVKWTRARSMLERVCNWFRASNTRRAWDCSMRLGRLGFDTPAVAVVGERRLFWRTRRSVLITEEITGALPLHLYLAKSCAGGGGRDRRRLLMRLLGSTLARMHLAGVYHSDFRDANLLVQTGSAGLKLYLIDTEAVRFLKPISARRRLKNLASINLTFVRGVTITDRLRVFRGYADVLGLDRPGRKRLLTRVIIECESWMTWYVGKPRIRPFGIAGGLPYRTQVAAITTALADGLRREDLSPGADGCEDRGE